MTRDAERLIAHLGIIACAFVGLSLGGQVGQALAAKRPDLIRALVLSNTGVKIATPQLWSDRIAAVRAGGMAAVADVMMPRWFTRAFVASPECGLWRALLTATPAEGFIGACGALAGADLIASTSALNLPALAIAGSEDAATPPDLVREMAGYIRGARFVLIRRAAHLAPVEQPAEYASVLKEFLDEVHAP